MSRARLVEKGERPVARTTGVQNWVDWGGGWDCVRYRVCVCAPQQEVNQVLARLWAKLAVSRVVDEAAGRTPDCG